MTQVVNQRTQAEALAICLEYGLLDASDVIAWADQQIAQSDQPHVVLCDIAMALPAHPLDIASLLRQLPGEVDTFLVIRQLVEYSINVLRSKRRPPRQVASLLYKLAREKSILSGPLRDDAYWFDDALDLSENGYIQDRPEEIAIQMIQMLEQWLASTDDQQTVR